MENLLLFREEEFDANFYYYAKVDIDHAFFLQLGKQRILAVAKMNEGIARNSFSGRIIVYKNPIDEIEKLISRKTIGIDERSLSAALYNALKSKGKLQNASEQLLMERMHKQKREIEAVAKATKITRGILDGLELRGGMLEEEVKKKLLIETIEYGLEPAFEPIVATAANARFPHYRAGKAKLKDMVLIDYGVKYDRYCSDVTRCFFLRKNKETKKMQEAYEKAQAVAHALLDDMPSIETGKDVAKASEMLMKKHGLPKLIHSIGHGVGLEVHEFPRLNMKSKDKIKNTIMAIEPAAYFSSFGIRFENTIYFDGRKARIL